MIEDYDNEKYRLKQAVGGFNVNNLLNNNIFLNKKNKVINLSFKIYDIITIDNQEILKLIFFNDLIVRIMKYTDKQGRAVATFDIVDEKKKEIVLTTKREFIGGLGIADIFFSMKYITQWEAPVLLKLCRSFVLGDIETIRNLMENFYLKIDEENEWNLKNKLGIK